MKINRGITNRLLTVFGILISVSGLILQVGYHLLRHQDSFRILFLDRAQWSWVHIASAVGILVAIICHFWMHRKWYKAFVEGRLRGIKRVTVILTVVSLLTIISGFLPLFVGDTAGRNVVVEIHDKVAVLFFILAFLHAFKRLHRPRRKSG